MDLKIYINMYRKICKNLMQIIAVLLKLMIILNQVKIHLRKLENVSLIKIRIDRINIQDITTTIIIIIKANISMNRINTIIIKTMKNMRENKVSYRMAQNKVNPGKIMMIKLRINGGNIKKTNIIIISSNIINVKNTYLGNFWDF